VSVDVDSVAAMTDRPAIEAIDLVKKFGGAPEERPAVDGVSFAVPEGTVMGLLGPNGAGKTTTVRMMTTLTVPTSGTARVAGYDVRTEPAMVRSNMGLTGQAATVDELLTGRENIRMIGALYGIGRRDVARLGDRLLEQFAIADAADRPVKSYSGGMRRRIDLAVSLIASPPVLFLDEPTTGLDPRSRIDLWDVLRGLVAQGTTLLLTTQYLEEADQLADHIVVVDRGRIIAEGTPLQLKQQAGNASLVVTVSHAADLPAARELISRTGVEVRRHRRTAADRDGRGHRRHDQGGRLASGQPNRGRRHRPVPAQPRRRVPLAHRASRRGRRDRGGPSMTTVARKPAVDASRPATRRTNIVEQSWIMVKRNMIHTKRMPEMLSDVTVQPIMFVLLFAFVFGASIANTGGASYREFLLPGIQAQTIVFTAFVVASGITADVEKGVIDRFRSLPIRRSSVLIGRSVASLIHSSIGIVVMAVTGLCIGWRIRGGVVEAVLAFALILVFGFGMIWFGILVGSLMRSVEAVNGVMFTVLFPITFLANTFAPTEPMPRWLRVMAEWNPVSSLAQAMRELWGNGPAAPPEAQLPLHHPILATILWSVAMTAVLAPFALRAYARRTSD
jgi:ABC transporter DrrB family efflux protein